MPLQKFKIHAFAAVMWNHNGIEICTKEYFLGYSFSQLHDFAFVVSLQKMIHLCNALKLGVFFLFFYTVTKSWQICCAHTHKHFLSYSCFNLISCKIYICIFWRHRHCVYYFQNTFLIKYLCSSGKVEGLKVIGGNHNEHMNSLY